MTEPNVEARQVTAPIALKIDADDMVTLQFGPMPVEDLAATMSELSTERGMENFLGQMAAGIEAERVRREQAGDPSGD